MKSDMSVLLSLFTIGIAAVWSEHATSCLDSSNISVTKQNGHHKIAVPNKDKHFGDNAFYIKLETSDTRVKRKVLEGCLKGNQPETKDNRCPPPRKSPQLVEYQCCVYCQNLDTQAECEPYQCTETHSCSPSPRRVPLDLSKRNISVLPQDVFISIPEVTDLDLSHNNIHVLPNNEFYKLSKLQNLSLSDNKITNISSEVFNGLTNLKSLKLSSCNVKVLQHNVFSTLSKLRKLYLDNNKIGNLPATLFYGLFELTHLYLERNRIWVLQPELFNKLSNLTILNLFGNAIMELPNNVFNDLVELTFLELRRNRISILPPNIFNGLSNLKKLYLSRNNITVLPHNVFGGLYQLTRLDLSGNMVSVLRSDHLAGLSNLVYLSLDGNNISVLPHGIFNDLCELTSLYLGSNKISVVPSDVFNRLAKLKELHLWYNEITALHYNLFHGLSGLTILHLGINNINTLPNNLFDGLSNLTSLFLNNNNITVVPNNLFHGLHQLVYLDLSNNAIEMIPFDLFVRLSALTTLHVHHNKISFLPYKVFYKMVADDEQYLPENATVSSLLTIEVLDFSYNKLTHLPRLPGNLSQLNIVGNKLEVTEHMFEGLYNLRHLYTDVPFMCCVRPPSVEEANCIETHLPLWRCLFSADLCISKGDAISSCFSLVGSTVLKVCLWIIGLCALGGNFAVIMYRLITDKGSIEKNYSLFTLNLAISDMLMGIYLLIIGVIDIHYNGKYAWNDHKWRNSTLCTTAGILSSVSSEMSTFLILMVTIDRLIAIMFPLSRLSQGNATWKRSVFVSLILWVVSGALAIIPVIAVQSYFKDEFYSQSSVCLALPLRGNEQSGTEYSFALFVCLNSFIFLFILVGQLCICKSLRKSGHRISSSQKRKREMTVAWTLFFVVATDFCCWFPIGAMGIASRFGVDIPDTVYAWVMVFVLPINAAVNPLLYTATAIWRNRKKKPLPVMSLSPRQNLPSGDSTTLASVIIQRSPIDR